MRINTYRISAGLKKPLRLAFLSDLHDTKNEPILSALEREAPQGILIGGDLIHNDKRYQRGFDLLEACAKRWPVFCAVGNHECCYGEGILKELERRGGILLHNRAVQFEGIWIGGLSSGYPLCPHRNLKKTPRPNLAFLEEFSKGEGFKLLMSHHPEYFAPYIKELPIDLTLSGHAHGGQWRLLGQGIYAPGQGLFPKYTSGLYENRLLVGRGLGNAYPIPRFGNPRELMILELGE